MSTVFHLLSVMLANDFFATSVSLRAGVDLHTRSRVGFSRSWQHSSQQASSQASVFQSATVSGSSGNSPLEIGQILLMSTVDTTTGKGKVMYATVGVQCHEPVVPSTLLDSGLQCPEGLAIQTISDSSFHLYVADPCLGRIKHYLIQRTGDLLESHGSTTITTSEANAVSIDSHTGDLFFTVNGTTSSAVATIKASTLEMLLEGSCHADSLVTVPQSEVEERAEAYRILRDEAASGVLDEPAVGCEVFFHLRQCWDVARGPTWNCCRQGQLRLLGKFQQHRAYIDSLRIQETRGTCRRIQFRHHLPRHPRRAVPRYPRNEQVYLLDRHLRLRVRWNLRRQDAIRRRSDLHEDPGFG